MEARGGGAIIGMSSLGSFRVIENYMLVGVSKAALEAAIRYLGVELAPLGIRVNGVSGAVVETGALEHFPNREEMLRSGRDRTPAGRMLEPQDLANAVAWLAEPGVVDGDRPDADRRRRLLAAGVATRTAVAGARRPPGVRPRRARPASRRGASAARAGRM